MDLFKFLENAREAAYCLLHHTDGQVDVWRDVEQLAAAMEVKP